MRPPFEIVFAIIGVLALPAVFAASGHLASGRRSILVRLAYSSLLITIVWLVALLLSLDVPSEATVFSYLCILGSGVLALYIFASFLAYSFRLETMLTIARHKGIPSHELAERFGGGAGLSTLFTGRLHNLRIMKAVRQVDDGDLQITAVGRVLATVYFIARRLWRMES